MKAVVLEFHQETNSFNPNVCTRDYFEQSRIAVGEELFRLMDKPCVLGGIFQALQEENVEIIPGISMFTMSGGRVDQRVMDEFINTSIKIINQHNHVDAVFISLHGATETTVYEDCSGQIIESIRKVVGHDTVIAASTDMHANITTKMVENCNIICGYQTYPHVDHFKTGYRTGTLGLSCLLDKNKPRMIQVKLPMIVPASGYTTMSGPFAELMNEGKSYVEKGEIIDFSIYQMQPWLDIEDASSSVIVIAREETVAEEFALLLAKRLYNLRENFKPNLYSIDQVIEIAENNVSDKPVVLVDSADSTNAGATGDSVAVVKKLLDRKSTLKTAIAVVDAPAANLAHKTGVGNKTTFSLGGTKLPEINETIEVECYVKSLHDGIFIQEGPAGRGMTNNIGPSAVLQVGNINILVCRHIFGNGDPQLFRAFGMEPTLYELLIVKACTSFRAAYSKFTDKIYDTDTPGAASVDLMNLPFKRLPKNFYPFNSLNEYKIDEIIYGKR
ncbi:M81 family metallopeptidase [Pseudogracilibacillus sp. SE30717A]|uniref:M81 family metallopeptidase n=1 Tax=Pseudogracilibacillus sp. SE30717A TaxID=3098293 RepID=UPI00300E3D01